MKKISLLLITFCLLVGCSSNKENSIMVGAVLPLTGNYAQYGKYMKQGIELAIEDAIDNKKIEEGQVTFIFEDSKAEARTSVNAINKLIEHDNIIACIPATSAVTLAMKPITNKNEVVLINATAISPLIEDAKDFVFSIIPDATFEGNFLANYAYYVLKKKRAAIIYRNDQSGIGFNESISKKFREHGGEIKYIGAQQPNDNNFMSHILKIKEFSDIDVIFVMLFGPEVANFAKQSKENGIEKQIMTYETFNSQTALSIAGNSANGIIFCSPKFDKNSKDSLSIRLRNKIKEKYNQSEYNYFIAAHYDAAMLIIEGISQGNISGQELKNYLYQTNLYKGLTGEIRFSEKGGAEVPLVVFTVKNEKFTILEEI